MNNRVKIAIKNNKAVFGPIIQTINSSTLIPLLNVAGFDFIYLDMEHGPFSMAQIGDMCMLARAFGIVPIVRPPSHRRDHLTRPLDAGAMGLLVPQVNNVVEAHAIVNCVKYHPMGERGFSSRGAHTGYQSMDVSEMISKANQDILIGIMIESVKGVENIEDIIAVEGIDLIVIGRGDLSQDLGLPGELDSELVRDSVDRVLDVCNKRSMPVGIICFDTPSAQSWLKRGVQMLNYGSDISMIVDPSRQVLEELRSFCENRGIAILRTME